MGIKASASVTIADISDGTAGTGIASTVVEYQAGSSGTTAPTGTWSTTVPATSASAPYLWTRVTYTYTDGSTPKVVYSVGSTPEGIEIGGRNLLVGTNQGKYRWTNAHNGGSYGIEDAEWNGVNAVKLTCTTATSSWRYFGFDGFIYNFEKLDPGGTYILSYDVIGSIGAGFVDFMDRSTDNRLVGMFTQSKRDTTDYGYHYEYIFVLKDQLVKSSQVVYLENRLTDNTEVTIANLKLEKGNKATDWTPAPEDTETKIDTLIPFITGTQTATTGSWTGVAPFSELKDGQQINYWLPYNGSGNATLNLTLSTGSTTGAVNCYYSGTTRISTQYPGGNLIRLIYRKDVSINGSSTKYTGWWADANYNTDTVDNRIVYFTGKTGSKGIWATSLFMEDGNGTYQNICTASDGTVTTSNRTRATTKIANANGFKIGSNIYYASTSYNANTNITGWGAVYSSYGNVFDSRYSLNTTLTAGSLTAYKPIYLVGTVKSDNLFYLDTTWWTQTPTTTGKVYILVGACYDSTTSNCRITLYEKNSWYICASDGTLQDYNYVMSNEKIASVDVEYYLSTSPTTLSGGSWVTTAPEWVNGKYMWSRTKKVDGYGIITYSPSTTGTCIAGATGATGATGKGVSTIVEQYYKSTSASSLSGGSWSTSYPGWENGTYIWTRSVITYTDSTSTTTTAVCVTGSKGSTGATGNGVKSSAVTYQAGSSGTDIPTGTWSSSIPSVDAGSYLWTKTVITYTNNSTTTSYSVGKMGNTGSTGNGISSTAITYQAGSSGTTAPTGNWSSSIPETSASTPYLWTRTIITYTNGSTTTSYNVGSTPEGAIDAANSYTDSQIETVSSALEASDDVIVGTQTAVTGSWTGVAKFAELKDGQRIAYWLPYNGSGNATLNLTLSNGSTTGAINCYYGGTSRLTTHYPAGNVIHFTYKKDISINGSSTKYTGWWADANYDSGNTYDRTRYSKSIKAGSTSITAHNIIVGKDGAYTHLKLGNAFDISYPILYAASSISSSATGTNNYLAIPFSVNTTQSITLTVYKPVYVKGKLSGALFTPVSTTPLTQAVPTSADGYQYILLGTAYSSSEVYLLNEHPIFQYHNGAFKSVQQIATEAAAAADSAQASADEANESILAWCYNNDKVYINGGKIYAGTVSATQIAAKAVTADKLSVSMLSAITANLGAVTAGSINIGNGQFVVSSTGDVTSKNITATGGTVGGWKLTSTRLASSDSISIGAKEAGLMFINEPDKPYIRVQDSSGAAVFQLNRDGTTSIVGDIKATSIRITDTISMIANNEAWGSGGNSYDILTATIDAEVGSKTPNLYIGASGLGITFRSPISSESSISTTSGVHASEFVCDATKTNYSKLTNIGLYVNTTNNAGTVWNEIQMRLSGNSGSQDFSLVGYRNGTQVFWHKLADSSGNTSFGKNLTVSGTISSSKAISVPGISYTTGQVTLTNKSYTCGLYDLRFGPSTDYDNKANLGIASARWVKVYAVSGTIGTSDERDKDIIGSVDDRYKRLYMALNPIMYRWKDTGIDRKVHIGLGAQTTERSAASCGIMFSEIGMIEHDYWGKPSKDGRTDRYGMNYQEVAVLTVPIVQEHEKKIENLTNKIESLQNLLMAALDKIALQNKTIEQLQENKEGE